MKKQKACKNIVSLVCLLLALLLLAGIAACEGGGAVLEAIETPEISTPVATNTPVPSPSPTPRPTPTSAPTELPPLSGKCGPLTWEVNPETRTLTISGKGPMPDFGDWNDSETPWGDLAKDTFVREGVYNRVVIEEGITRIGESAFVETTLRLLPCQIV